VHRDRSKELADNRRFTLAANIEVYFCDPQPGGSAGRNLRKVRFWREAAVRQSSDVSKPEISQG
jgi:IS30 family transposase